MKKIFLISCLYLFHSCKNELKIESYEKPMEVFLIPDHLDNIAVVYEAKETIDFKKKIIYNIPASGLLIVKFQRNSSMFNHKYILVDKKNVRTDLQDFAKESYWKRVKNDKRYMLESLDGSYVDGIFSEGSANQIKISSDNPHAVKWFGIIIGSERDNQNILRKKLFYKIDSISKYIHSPQ
jgi:hypothetical protein